MDRSHGQANFQPSSEVRTSECTPGAGLTLWERLKGWTGLWWSVTSVCAGITSREHAVASIRLWQPTQSLLPLGGIQLNTISSGDTIRGPTKWRIQAQGCFEDKCLTTSENNTIRQISWSQFQDIWSELKWNAFNATQMQSDILNTPTGVDFSDLLSVSCQLLHYFNSHLSISKGIKTKGRTRQDDSSGLR